MEVSKMCLMQTGAARGEADNFIAVELAAR